MTAILVSVHLPDVNGIPKDDTINTFVIGGLGASVAGQADITDAHIPTFYNGIVSPSGNKICQFLASNLDRTANACHMDTYTLTSVPDSTVPVLPMGSPFRRTTFTLGALLGPQVDLPRECAAVLSLHGNLVGLAEDTPGGVAGPGGDTHPAARKRGRIYLGPLNDLGMGAGANGPGLNALFRGVATGAAKTLADDIAAALEGLSWSVWSRVSHTLAPVLGGWMDDAFDTQRRRGIGASTRTLWAV
jgi:hypothetical protein